MWNRTSSSAYPVTFCALTGWLHFRFTSKISADPGKMFLHLQFRWPGLFSFSFRKPWPNGLASRCKSKFAKAEVVYGLAMSGQTDRKFTQVSKSCKCVYTRKWLTINLYWLALGGQTVQKSCVDLCTSLSSASHHTLMLTCGKSKQAVWPSALLGN